MNLAHVFITVIVVITAFFVFIQFNDSIINSDTFDLINHEKITALTEGITFEEVDGLNIQTDENTMICFFDTSRDLTNLPILRDYPLVKDILESDTNLNIFYINKESKELIKSRYDPNLCLDLLYICKSEINKNIQLNFKGKNNCATVYNNWQDRKGLNLKDESIFTDNIMFLSWNKDETSWSSILTMLPVSQTISKYENTPNIFPYSVLTKETTPITEDIIFILDEHTKTQAYIYGDSPIGHGDIDESHSLIEVNLDTYFEFWDSYNDIVFSSLFDEDLATKAALFAGTLNSPIIFIDQNNMYAYEDYIENKHAWIFYSDLIEGETIEFITDQSALVTYIVSPDNIPEDLDPEYTINYNDLEDHKIASLMHVKI